MANVLWCTGFVLDFSWVDLPVVGSHGFPLQDRGVVRSCKGLYSLGVPFLHTLSSGLLGGVGRDADHVASHIAARTAEARATSVSA